MLTKTIFNHLSAHPVLCFPDGYNSVVILQLWSHFIKAKPQLIDRAYDRSCGICSLGMLSILLCLPYDIIWDIVKNWISVMQSPKIGLPVCCRVLDLYSCSWLQVFMFDSDGDLPCWSRFWNRTNTSQSGFAWERKIILDIIKLDLFILFFLSYYGNLFYVCVVDLFFSL